jgi:hypothetical protein
MFNDNCTDKFQTCTYNFEQIRGENSGFLMDASAKSMKYAIFQVEGRKNLCEIKKIHRVTQRKHRVTQSKKILSSPH